MGNLNFQDFFVQLEEMGLTDTVLPFLLIFAILFTILDRTKILGSGKKGANVVVALVISLMVVIPHVTGNYPAGQDPVEILNTALPNVSIVLIAIIMLLVLIGAFGAELGIGTGSIGFVAFVAIGVIIWIFGSSAGWFHGVPGFLQESDIQATLVVLLTIGLVIWAIAGGGTGGVGGAFKGFLNELMRVGK